MHNSEHIANMSNTPTITSVLQAIHALYDANDQMQQKSANEYLHNFSTTEEAWYISIQILSNNSISLSQEILFFIVNLLYNKVRNEWITISETQKNTIYESLQQIILQIENGQRQLPMLVCSKLLEIIAYMMIAIPDTCRSTITSVLYQISSSVQSPNTVNTIKLYCSLGLIRCVCEQLNVAELPYMIKDTMEIYIRELNNTVLQVLSDVIEWVNPIISHHMDIIRSSIYHEVFECLKVWSRAKKLSLISMFQSHNRLLVLLLNTIKTEQRGPKNSAHITICVDILCEMFEVEEKESHQMYDSALNFVIQELLITRQIFEQVSILRKDELAHAISVIVTSFGENFVDWVLQVKGSADREAQSTAFGEYMLVLGMHPRKQIASLALEFWLCVAELPVQSRPLFYQHTAFMRLTEIILNQCTYTLEPSAMDELDFDELIAYRTGGSGIEDIFLAIFALLPTEFLVLVRSICSGKVTCSNSLPNPTFVYINNSPNSDIEVSDWRAMEVALFSLTLVADPLRQRLQRPNQSIDLEGCFIDILHGIFKLNYHTSLPTVKSIACKLLGQLASWFTRHEKYRNVVPSVFQYLESSLGHPYCRSNAAKAFMILATNCKSPDGINVEVDSNILIAGINQVIQDENAVAIVDRLLVVEGVVRYAIHCYEQQCCRILESIIQKSLSRIGQFLIGKNTATNGGGSRDLTTNTIGLEINCELRTISTVIKCLQTPSNSIDIQIISLSVFNWIWPSLDRISSDVNWHSQEIVVSSLCEVFGWCLQALNYHDTMYHHLPAISNFLANVFVTYQWQSCLECACIIVGVFGRKNEETEAKNLVVMASLSLLLNTLCGTTFRYFHTHDNEDSPRLLLGLFDLIYRFLLFQPDTLLSSPEFHILLDLACVCVTNQNRKSTLCIAKVLEYLLSEQHLKLAPYKNPLILWLTNSRPAKNKAGNIVYFNGLENLINACVRGLVAASPNTLLDTLAKTLFLAIRSHLELIASWNHDISASICYNAMQLAINHEGELENETYQFVAQKLIQYVAESTTIMSENSLRSSTGFRRFRALAIDFAKVCRKEIAVDSLYSYEV